MKEPLFTGVCTAMVTPFLQDKVNYPMMEQLIYRQIAAGITSVVICGTTGESATLTDHEKNQLFKCAKKAAGNSCLVIAGTGSNSTEHAIKLSHMAEDAGADALLVVSPYYNKATPEGLYIHFAAIAASVNIPVILYNVPSRTGVDIPVDVYAALAEIPNIIGVKEATTDIKKILKIRAQCPADFYVWSGNDDMTVAVTALGGKGVISVLSNILPAETSEMANAASAGDYTKASQLQCALCPITDFLFCEVNPIPVKAAMKEIGFDCGNCRLPLTPLSENRQPMLKKLF